jgi:hypothetical protein
VANCLIKDLEYWTKLA